MGQVNINPTSRSSGSGTAIAVLLGVIVVILLIWLVGFNGMNTLTGSPANAPASISKPAGSTINISPNVNVQPPASGSTNPAPANSAPAAAAPKP